MMVDPGRVRKLLDRLTEETKKLENLGEFSSEELLSDPVKLAAVKYGFVVEILTTRLADFDQFKASVARAALEPDPG